MLPTPTFRVMKIILFFQDAKLVPMSIESPMYEFQGKKLTKVSASKDVTGTLNISFTNIDYSKPHEVKINL